MKLKIPKEESDRIKIKVSVANNNPPQPIIQSKFSHSGLTPATNGSSNLTSYSIYTPSSQRQVSGIVSHSSSLYQVISPTHPSLKDGTHATQSLTKVKLNDQSTSISTSPSLPLSKEYSTSPLPYSLGIPISPIPTGSSHGTQRVPLKVQHKCVTKDGEDSRLNKKFDQKEEHDSLQQSSNSSPLISHPSFKNITESQSFSLEENDIPKPDYDNFTDTHTVYDLNKKNNWPKSTNLRCWHCTLHFDTVPCGLPTDCDGEKFKVCGCFCSFNCMVAYNQKSRNSHKWEISSLINQMYKKIFKESKNILPTPDYELLEEYGGKLSREDYRKCIKNGIVTYELLLPPIINIGYTSQKIERNINKKNKPHYNPLNFKKIDNAVMELDENMIKNTDKNKNKNTFMDNFIRVRKNNSMSIRT